MTRTQFDSMQELVEFITATTAISTSPPPTRCSSTSPQLQGEARHLREGLKGLPTTGWRA